MGIRIKSLLYKTVLGMQAYAPFPHGRGRRRSLTVGRERLEAVEAGHAQHDRLHAISLDGEALALLDAVQEFLVTGLGFLNRDGGEHG